jgi:hypothetical protein
MTTEEVLAELRRPGWRRVGSRAATKAEQTMDQSGNTRTIQVEVPGQEVWTIVGPNGQPDEVTVFRTGEPSEVGVDDGQYTIVKGPQNTPSAADVKPKEGDQRRNVTGGYVVQEKYQGGNWVTDPDVPPVAYDPKLIAQPKEGDVRDNVQSGYKVREKFSGGNWITDASVPPVAYDPKLQSQPKEGDVRPNVTGGYSVQEVFKGGSWVTDSSVPPKPYDPKLAGMPKEGDSRDNVQGGYKIRENFRGGSWITDPSVPPVAYDPKLAAQPKEGDRRPNVQGGYTVQEIYKGGNWVTDPSVAPTAYDPKLANQPKEGDRRPNVQSGYTVQEVYKGGQWVIDPSVAPTRYTPREPSSVAATADTPYIARSDDNGNVTWQPNQNYQPKTPAEIAGRVATLQQTAKQQQDQLRQKAESGAITWDQANAQFNQWWDQNIAPHAAALDAASKSAAIEQNRTISTTRTAAQNAATSAGTEATNSFNAYLKTNPGGDNPVYQDFMAGVMAGKPINTLNARGAFQYDAPNPIELSQQAVQNSLKYIDPSMAQAAGMPPPNLGAIDVNGGLNRLQYTPGGPPPSAPMPAVPATAAPAAPAAPGAAQMPSDQWFQDLFKRQADDVALQRMQAQVRPLLPPGAAGVPGVDPRLSGNLDPNQYFFPG